MHRLLLLFPLVALFLAGCGAQRAASQSTTLTVWYSTDDPVERAWAHTLMQRFQASHPQVHVRFTPYSFEDMNTKLQLAMKAGNPPDLAYVTPRGPGIPVYLGAHQLRDLTAAARSHGWAARLRPGLLASYNHAFGFMGAPKGHTMAVPTAVADVGVLYNKRLLARLHLSVPATLAQFQSDLPRAKAAGYTPLGIGNADGWLGDDWYLTLVNALTGPSTFTPEQNLAASFSFHQSPFVQAADTLRSWSRAGYLTHDFGGLDAQDGVDLFFRGKTLFQLVSSSENSQILQDQRQTHLPVGFFAFPKAGGGRVMPGSGYLGWVVPKGAAHPQQAVELIDSLLSSQTAHLLLGHGVLPAMRDTGFHAKTGWQQSFLRAANTAQPGVYIDAAPVPSLNATMEANVQLLLQGYEPPSFLVTSLQKVYSSHGSGGSAARIDGEF
jgi:raffinose/stachyose/melibiose transport system substrate-binding protein